jgi:phage terminase small subunit
VRARNNKTMENLINPKQERFCQEYIIDLNATQAAIRTGYSKKTAYSQGQRLLKNVEIKTRIQQLKDERAKRTGITSDRVLKEIGFIGFSRISDFVEFQEEGGIRVKRFDEMPKDSSSAIKDVKQDRNIRETSKGNQTVIQERISCILHDKIKALELLGRHLGLFEKRSLPLENNMKFKFVYGKNENCNDGGNKN